MSRLLRFEQPLGIAAKGLDLWVAHEHTLHALRIVTDVRPVFKADLERPGGAVIIHKLNLTYHDGDELREFFVAMDSADIRRLRTLLDRAERKAASLTSLLEASSVPLLGE